MEVSVIGGVRFRRFHCNYMHVSFSKPFGDFLSVLCHYLDSTYIDRKISQRRHLSEVELDIQQ